MSRWSVLLSCFAVLTVVGCSRIELSSGSQDAGVVDPVVEHELVGEAFGLVEPVVLELSAAETSSETLLVQDSGRFAFRTRLREGSSFDVSMASAGTSQTCELDNHQGIVTGETADIRVDCERLLQCDEIDCGAHGTCVDDTGSAQCVCDAGYTGALCTACDSGFQDDDGDGTCAAPCATNPWWDDAFAFRSVLTYTNEGDAALPAGTAVAVAFDHAAQVELGRSLASGDDVRVVRDDGGEPVELSRTSESGFNLSDTDVLFPLAVDLAPGATTTAYALYWGNPDAAAAPRFDAPPKDAIATHSDGASLLCDRRGGSFYAIQLRQLAPDTNEYEIHATDRTAQASAYGKIKITDDSGTVLINKTFVELGGTCCSPPQPKTRSETLTIDAARFTVFLETREFSGSRRWFGCKLFATGNPPTNQVGSNTRTYDVVPQPRERAVQCGL